MRQLESSLIHKTVVLVTDQFSCDRVIKAGRAIADLSKTDLFVINVSGGGCKPDPDAIQYLFDETKSHQGTMTVLYGDNVYRTIVGYIKQGKTRNVLSGMPEGPDSLMHQIWRKFTHINFFTVSLEGEICQQTAKNHYTTV